MPATRRRHTHTHTRLTTLFPGLPGWAGTRQVKSIWILLKQETLSGSGISWAICKSAPRSRQITRSVPHHSVFTGRMSFLPPNQQCQSTEGIVTEISALTKLTTHTSRLKCKKTVIIVMHTFDNNRSRLYEVTYLVVLPLLADKPLI